VSDTVVAGLRTVAPVVRLAGSDRYGTAAIVSSASHGPGTPLVYVATGNDFPDALTAAAVAGSARAPVLLVTPGSIPAVTAAELARLRPGRIVIVGGAGAVSESVRAALGRYAPVTRLAGADRYGTAAAVGSLYAPRPGMVYVATGADFPDALAAAAAAGGASVPLLLVQPNALPAPTTAELSRLRPARIAVVGGSGVVSEAVRGALGGLTTDPGLHVR
jgi:putative cell wall-binding protein